MLNAKKIEMLMESNKISKVKLCQITGMARTTLDAILNGSDAKVSTIEAIAKCLGVQVGELFEPSISNAAKTAGPLSPASNSGHITQNIGDSEAWRLLAEERKERIDELKDRLAKYE